MRGRTRRLIPVKLLIPRMSVFQRSLSRALLILALSVPIVFAQDPTGVLEGQVTDPSSARVPGARIAAQNLSTGFTASQKSAGDGSFRFSYLPVGEYDLHVAGAGFANFDAHGIRIDVGRVVDFHVPLTISKKGDTVEVTGNAATVDVSSTLGSVVSSRDAADLPLNGRNLTQLGLLQPGVAPMTFGLAEAGGILRSGQAYAVNGQPPESNNYLLDGVTNVDSVNGGFALHTPPDAVSEFRILTSNAPAEFGETSGATTTVITKSGTNEFHGDLYEFLRNNAFDARNFFAATTEPLHQNQFGAHSRRPHSPQQRFFLRVLRRTARSTGGNASRDCPDACRTPGGFLRRRKPAGRTD